MIEVILIKKDDRFIVHDREGNELSNCARKSDAKKILRKRDDLTGKKLPKIDLKLNRSKR